MDKDTKIIQLLSAYLTNIFMVVFLISRSTGNYMRLSMCVCFCIVSFGLRLVVQLQAICLADGVWCMEHICLMAYSSMEQPTTNRTTDPCTVSRVLLRTRISRYNVPIDPLQYTIVFHTNITIFTETSIFTLCLVVYFFALPEFESLQAGYFQAPVCSNLHILFELGVILFFLFCQLARFVILCC